MANRSIYQFETYRDMTGYFYRSVEPVGSTKTCIFTCWTILLTIFSLLIQTDIQVYPGETAHSCDTSLCRSRGRPSKTKPAKVTLVLPNQWNVKTRFYVQFPPRIEDIPLSGWMTEKSPTPLHIFDRVISNIGLNLMTTSEWFDLTEHDCIEDWNLKIESWPYGIFPTRRV